MGQKINPIGLRVGISLKWAFSWFNPSDVQKSSDSAQHGQILLKKGVVTSRGGYFLSSFDERLRGFFKRYLYVSRNRSRRFLPVSIQYRKGANNYLFVFLTYVKLRGQRRKRVKKIKRTTKGKRRGDSLEKTKRYKLVPLKSRGSKSTFRTSRFRLYFIPQASICIYSFFLNYI